MRRTLFSAILALQRFRVVSYPNSGRTWLRTMFADLDAYPRFTHAGSKFRLHHPPERVCEGMQRYRRFKILFVYRDPKDTVASNYFQVTRKDRYWRGGEIKEFIRDPEFGFERIVAFNLGWMARRDRFRRFHAVAYEMLREDTAQQLRAIVDFIGLPGVGDDEIRAAVDHNSFESMRRRELSGELYQRFGDRFATRHEARADPERLKVRRGKSGGHRDYLDAADVAYCDEILARYGYAL